jgi:hypothetical protein
MLKKMALIWGLIFRPQLWAVERNTVIIPKLDHKYLECFEIWRWGRMEISRADRVRNGVLKSVKEQRNIVHTVK